MNELQILEIANEAIWVLIKISLPIMLTALLVGLTISLFQALTQIQEMTLAFVPKIVSVFLMLLLCVPFMISSLQTLTDNLMERIIAIEAPSEQPGPQGDAK